MSELYLRPKHELLGARLVRDEELGLELPAAYGALDDEVAALRGGVGLADLTGLFAQLVTGETAVAFVSATCAAAPLSVGECAHSAVLTGDGSLAAVPLVARTGDAEWLLWDGTPRAALLDAWTSFLVRVGEGDTRPFAATRLEDVSDSLVPLLVAGPGAPAVLADYTDALPAPGHVASIPLDRITCLVAGLPPAPAAGKAADTPAYLVFVGPRYVRVLWQSLLSFPEVTPVGREALAAEAATALPWWPAVATADHVRLAAGELAAWHLARPDGGFVGARALST